MVWSIYIIAAIVKEFLIGYLGSIAARGVWIGNLHGISVYQPMCTMKDTSLLNCSYSTTDASNNCGYRDATSLVCLTGDILKEYLLKKRWLEECISICACNLQFKDVG